MSMAQKKTEKLPTMTLEENLKKATTELLILHLLAQREFYISELTATLYKHSNGALKIVFPYSAVYRLQQAGCIQETDKRCSPDGRRRQYLSITDTGRQYLAQLRVTYDTFTTGVAAILGGNEPK